MSIDLEQKIIDQIIDTIKSNSQVEDIILFGSRAKGTAKNGSDIDIAIIGANINLKEICALGVRIEELDLPYKVDLIDYKAITNEDLKMHIDRVGMHLI